MDIKNVKKNQLVFIPLGGSNEIGLNCNLYHYNGKWLVVDCGIGFTSELPGANVMVPDVSVLKKIKNNIVGIILTHLHEDHIGAIQYLWEDLRCPIYASRFTKAFLLEKLKEYSFFNQVEIIEANEGDILDLKPFSVELISLTHSTPEMNAILIKTEEGNILNTGDWKFDPKPMLGAKSDIKRLKQLGTRKEVLATVCDSTNIFNDGETTSENELYSSFYNIIKSKKGLVVCAMFASNISRVKTLVDIAKKTNREIVLLGSSLFRITKVARDVGYLDESVNFLNEFDVKSRKKKNLLVIATGCQGETGAGIDKLANNGSRYIKLNKDDTVVFASRVIPGNEKEVNSIYNKLAELDVEVITDKTELVHVSGHYCRNDLMKLYSYVKPKIAIAVHGEQIHLKEHVELAKKCGIQETVKGKNGAVFRFMNGKAEKIGQLDLQLIAVDGKRLVSSKDDIFKNRRKMEECGAIFVSFIVNEKYGLISMPIVNTPGVYDLEKDLTMRDIIIEDIIKTYKSATGNINRILSGDKAKQKARFQLEENKRSYIDQQVKTALNRICEYDIGKRPLICINYTKLKTVPNTKNEKKN